MPSTSRIPLRGNLNKLVSAAGNIVPSITTLPEVVVTAKRIPRDDMNSTKNLVYPDSVESDAQQGHYICFWVREIDQAKLDAYKGAKNRIAETKRKMAATAGGPPDVSGTARAKHIANHSIDGFDWEEDIAEVSGNPKQNSIFLKSRPTKKMKTAISLYMPPSVQVSYEAKYGEQEIGFLAEGGYEAIKAFQRGWSKKDTMAAVNTLEMGAQLAILKTLDVAAPGASALFAMDRGKIITPKMELMFEGIGRRNFSFSFVFIPKSQPEADTIQEIVFMFKKHMAANYVGGGANGLRDMSFPDQFDIEYMYMGKSNDNINKIATCALTKMDVEYGGDRYVAYDGGVPQTTKLSLNFTEFEIITREHIERGY